MDQIQSIKMQPGLRQYIKLQQADLLQLSDVEFRRQILEVEQTPLFKFLRKEADLIRFQRYPRTDIAPGFYQLKEDRTISGGSLDIESALVTKKQVVGQIERLGENNFKKYFLFPEICYNSDEIASACQIELSTVEAINAFVNDFTIMSEFYYPSNLSSAIIHYTKIASIETRGEYLYINYYSPSYARGRYLIDYGKYEILVADGRLNTGQINEARKLLKKLELINHRMDTLHNVIQSLITKQATYLETGNSMTMLPFSQKEIARETGLAPSTVSRALHGKSISTPWNEEIPLRSLLPSPRWFKKESIKQLLQTEPSLASDEIIRSRLQEKLGISISRRSVSDLRSELKMPARGKYAKSSSNRIQ